MSDGVAYVDGLYRLASETRTPYVLNMMTTNQPSDGGSDLACSAIERSIAYSKAAKCVRTPGAIATLESASDYVSLSVTVPQQAWHESFPGAGDSRPEASSVVADLYTGRTFDDEGYAQTWNVLVEVGNLKPIKVVCLPASPNVANVTCPCGHTAPLALDQGASATVCQACGGELELPMDPVPELWRVRWFTPGWRTGAMATAGAARGTRPWSWSAPRATSKRWPRPKTSAPKAPGRPPPPTRQTSRGTGHELQSEAG